MKKIISFVLVFVVAAALVACGNSATTTQNSGVPDKLVIWSFTDELDTAGDIQHFKDMYTAPGKPYEGMDVEFNVVETATYMQTILPVLESGVGAPDVLTGELDMIQQFNEAGYLADLESLMEADPDVNVATEKADFKDYIWQSGENDQGRLTALSWQVTPGAIFFKVDMAAEVWGDEPGFPSDPNASDYNAQVSTWVSANKFDSNEDLLLAQQEVKAYDPSYRLFPDDQAVRFFAAGTDNPVKWLDANGKLNPAKITEQIPYIELVKTMYGETIADSLTANAGEWSGEWYAGMGKTLTDASDNEWHVMAYTLPTWGLKYVLEPNMERVDANGNDCTLPENPTADDEAACTFKGNWGMGVGPNSYFWGGTYLAVRSGSQNQTAAFAFIKSMLFDHDRLVARQEADGDMYSMASVMDPVIANYAGRPSLGGMNHLAIFNQEAAKIDLSNVTEYDRRLNTLLGNNIDLYKTGDYDNLAQCLTGFYNGVKTSLPEIYQDGLPTG